MAEANGGCCRLVDAVEVNVGGQGQVVGNGREWWSPEVNGGWWMQVAGRGRKWWLAKASGSQRSRVVVSGAGGKWWAPKPGGSKWWGWAEGSGGC